MRCAVAKPARKDSGPKLCAPHSHAGKQGKPSKHPPAHDDPLARMARAFGRLDAISAVLIARSARMRCRSPAKPGRVRCPSHCASRDRDRIARPPMRAGRRVSTSARSPSAIASVMSWGTEKRWFCASGPEPQQGLPEVASGVCASTAAKARPSGSSAGRRPSVRISARAPHAAGQLVRIVALEAVSPTAAISSAAPRPGTVVERALHLARKQHVDRSWCATQQIVSCVT